MDLTIKRIASRNDGVFGVLLVGNEPIALTLERPWRNNRRGESCIPAGDYLCKRIKSVKFGNTFEVENVPGRSAILFHKGNVFEDSHGCILVGEQFSAWANGTASIAASAAGFREFLDRTAGTNEFNLSIREMV